MTVEAPDACDYGKLYAFFVDKIEALEKENQELKEVIEYLEGIHNEKCIGYDKLWDMLYKVREVIND
jgi:uncharacterized protein (UPF0335 family)